MPLERKERPGMALDDRATAPAPTPTDDSDDDACVDDDVDVDIRGGAEAARSALLEGNTIAWKLMVFTTSSFLHSNTLRYPLNGSDPPQCL